ncbi:MAG: hypothetical protein Q7T40_07255 [Methylobacter sp.]|nr:hypothetical protein [Methylobacter sp.]
MKSVYLIKKNSGIGLIEVLITTVVVAVGLLAVASMQGGFMSGSATNKVRAEALTLAEQKIETLKNNIVIADYTAIAGSPAPESIGGVNATFSRTWAITPLTTPTRKSIAVTVTWGGASADERVVLSSEIAFSDPGNSAGIAAYGNPSGQSPSPNQQSSQTISNAIDLFDSSGNLKEGVTRVGSTNLYQKGDDLYRDNGNKKTGTLVFYCSDLGAADFDVDLRNPLNYDATTGVLKTTGLINLLTKRLNLDGVSGNEAIRLYTRNYIGDTADGSCTPVHEFNGGAIVTIKGNIHTVNNLDDIKIDFNKTDMYCVFNHGTSRTVRPYACYAGANCNVSPAGDNSDVNTCPNPSAADAKVGPGGFSGNVGILNVDDDGANKESVCYLEEINNQESQRSTARKYKGMLGSQEQGVNQSYSCQDYLIVGRRNNFSQLAAACAVAVGKLNVTSLPPKEVVRTISDSNTVAGIDSNFCNNLVAKDYKLTITVANATDNTEVTVEGGTAAVTCSRESGTDTFTCSGKTKSNVLSVIAVASAARGNCTVELDTTSSQPATGRCTITLVTPPIYTLNGTITGSTGQAPKVTITNDFGVTNTCTATNTTFSCVIQTNYSTVRILGSKKGNKTPYCTVSDLNLEPGQSEIRENVCVLKY